MRSRRGSVRGKARSERAWSWHAVQTFSGVVVPASQAVPLPDGVPFEQGACLGIPGITAHRCVHVAGRSRHEARRVRLLASCPDALSQGARCVDDPTVRRGSGFQPEHLGWSCRHQRGQDHHPCGSWELAYPRSRKPHGEKSHRRFIGATHAGGLLPVQSMSPAISKSVAERMDLHTTRYPPGKLERRRFPCLLKQRQL